MPRSPSVYSVLPAQNNDPAASIPALSAEASFARFSLCWNSPHRQFLLPSFVLHSVALYAPGWQQFRRGSPADGHNFPSSLPSGYNRFSHPDTSGFSYSIPRETRGFVEFHSVTGASGKGCFYALC